MNLSTAVLNFLWGDGAPILWLMPRKNPLSARELDICRRLREFRLRTKLSQVAFANEVGLDSARLASYEHGRAPVKYGLARLLSVAFKVNLEWLATGKGGLIDLRPVSDVAFVDANPEDRFGQVFDEHLAEGKPFHDYATTVFYLPPKNARYVLLRQLQDDVKEWLCRVPDDKLAGFVAKVIKHSEGLITKYPYSPEDLLWQRVVEIDEAACGSEKLAKNKLLTNITATGNVSPVKSTMANLLDRLNKATSQRGMKSELAKVMGVPLSNISQWLSGEREPGGETTLRLLHWVEQQERQQKSPGGVKAPPEPKTQVRKSKYEKQTQVRKKW
jgi:transcriptional regulator with XRE-family HTH domain